MADVVSSQPHLEETTTSNNTNVQDVPVTAERKPRKSVAFSEGTTIVDENGAVTTQPEDNENTKDTALSHTLSTLSLPQALEALTDSLQGNEDGEGATSKAADDDDVANMLKGMKKKKKKSAKADDAEGDGAADGDAPAGDLDLSSMKKKKKKKAPKEGEDDFAAKLAALDIDKEAEDGEATPAATEAKADDGDMEKGTGIWAHNETKRIGYEALLGRFFTLLAQKNPDHASSGSRSYKIPPPQCLREGNKKTIFANLNEICKRMKRTDEHVTSYLFAELGTSGSVDGSRRLVIKGRFQQKQIENVLRRYISMHFLFSYQNLI